MAMASIPGKPVKSERPAYWKFIVSTAMMGIAGALDNTADVVKFNYHLFAQRWPNADRQWFDPKLSARNKYKDWPHDKSAAYFGSKTFLVFTTDFYHAARFARNMLIAGAFTITLTIGQPFRFWRALAIGVMHWAAFAVGSGISNHFYGMGR